MPRLKFRRELCECLDCVYPRATGVPASSTHAAAVMDPPPKCVILFGEGLLQQAVQGRDSPTGTGTEMEAGTFEQPATGSPSQEVQTSLDTALCPHLDGVARDGCSGLVALRETFPGTEKSTLDALMQLFGPRRALLEDMVASGNGVGSTTSNASIATRFKDLHVALISSDSSAIAAAGKMGFLRASLLNSPQLTRPAGPPTSVGHLPVPQAAAATILQSLGLGGLPAAQAAFGDALDGGEESDDTLDCMTLHVRVEDFSLASLPVQQPSSSTESASESAQTQCQHGEAPDLSREEAFDAAVAGLEWLDALVRQLNRQPGAREQLLLVVLLSWGKEPPSYARSLLQPGGGQITGVSGSEGPAGEHSAVLRDAETFVGVLRPAQSFEMPELADGQGSAYTDSKGPMLASPMLAVHRLPTVIRVDGCNKMSLRECMMHAGNGPILAAHVLPELAYKLGRAPKYGA